MRRLALCGLALLVSVCRVSSAQGAATVSGLVVDLTGTAVEGASVVLVLANGGTVQASTSDAIGTFLLTNVQPGVYRVTLHAAGFAQLTTQSFTVTPETVDYVLPRCVLDLNALSASVTVRPTDVIAGEQ